MNPRVEELINRRIDGDLGPAETNELAEILLRDPEARSYFEELERITGWLGRVPVAEVPPSLKAGVLSGIRPGSPRSHRPVREPSLLQRWFGAGFLPRPAYAWTAAAGFLAGVVVVALLQGGWSTIDRSQVSGTMAPSRATARVELGTGDPGGSFSLYPGEGGVKGVLEIGGSGQLSVTVSFDASQLSLAGIDWSGGAAEIDTREPGVIRLRQSGTRQYTLRWDGSPSGATPFRVGATGEAGELEGSLAVPDAEPSS